MRIEETVYFRLLESCIKAPPEMGGILGGHSQIIDCFNLIEGKNDNNMAFYSPDVKRMNAVIDLWRQNGVDFYGIFHSHPSCCTALSEEDKKYIVEIMKAMPEQVRFLYFPILIPYKELYVYKAVKSYGKVKLVSENLQVVRR